MNDINIQEGTIQKIDPLDPKNNPELKDLLGNTEISPLIKLFIVNIVEQNKELAPVFNNPEIIKDIAEASKISESIARDLITCICKFIKEVLKSIDIKQIIELSKNIVQILQILVKMGLKLNPLMLGIGLGILGAVIVFSVIRAYDSDDNLELLSHGKNAIDHKGNEMQIIDAESTELANGKFIIQGTKEDLQKLKANGDKIKISENKDTTDINKQIEKYLDQ